MGRNNGWNVERIISITCARLWPAEPQLDQALNRVRVISCCWFIFAIARMGGCGGSADCRFALAVGYASVGVL